MDFDPKIIGALIGGAMAAGAGASHAVKKLFKRDSEEEAAEKMETHSPYQAGCAGLRHLEGRVSAFETKLVNIGETIVRQDQRLSENERRTGEIEGRIERGFKELSDKLDRNFTQIVEWFREKK